MNGGALMNSTKTIQDGEKTGIDSIDTYTTIVRTSRKLFMEFGYRGISTRQIADACGITQPALYHHFKNKQSLYLEVIHQSLFQTKEALTRINSTTSNLDKRLTQLSCYMMKNFQEDITQMFHDISHEFNQEQQQMLHQLWKKSFLLPVEKMIEDGVTSGQIKNMCELDTTTTDLAFLILNLIKTTLPPSYFRTQSETEQQQIIEKKAKFMVYILLNGIGA